MNAITRVTYGLALAFLGGIGAAQASIQVVGTRVIYPAGQREVTVNLINNNDSPRLLQAWVDSGDGKETAETTTAPFVVTPPMSRIDPGKGQSLRLVFTGSGLAQDRESVYWLNMLEIPPRPKAQGEEAPSFVQFAVRTRIKIFYRPKGLEGTPAEAYKHLAWRLVSQGNGMALECTNPTPFNVSFGKIGLKSSETNKSATGGGMCPAKGQQTFPVQGAVAKDDHVVFSVIDDFGGLDPQEANLSR